MPHIGYPHNFLRGLSDFWQRFFADSDQLEALYDGTAILCGQAYLDLLSNVLSVSLADCPVFNKEYYKLITIREDQVAFEVGLSSDDDRWVVPLQDGLVKFHSLDNRVLEPTASLQDDIDYNVVASKIRFYRDPTDPNGDGLPLNGFAKRQVDVVVGGALDELARGTSSWRTRGIVKGDVVRLLDVGPLPSGESVPPQFKRRDLPVVLLRDDAVYLQGSGIQPLESAAFTILRRPYDPFVTGEQLLLSDNTAVLLHTRLEQGSVKVFGKASGGGDVVEGVDYLVDYERGRIVQLTSWLSASLNQVNYEWRREVMGLTTDGTLRGPTTIRVTQMAFWAPDALVDRQVLSNNFGSLIGREGPSSESYRAFLLGIFQLYVLGPVLHRIESALNVILGLPVIQEDGELLLGADLTGVDVNIVKTRRTSGALAEYEFPKLTPLRAEVLDSANAGSLVMAAFEPLTDAVTVTDYIQDPTWYHNIVIPSGLFSPANGATVPDTGRRTVSPRHIEHLIGPADGAQVGDPGLYVGADEDGIVPPDGHPILRRRFGFFMMDRYFKTHMFFVRFDSTVFLTTGQGVKFLRIVDDLNDLIFSAKPAHSYIYVQPSTAFLDTVKIYELGYYQPQRYDGANFDDPEMAATADQLPSPTAPFILLGLTQKTTISGPSDKVVFADYDLVVGGNMRVGDYFHYEKASFTEDVGSFPTFTIPGAPVSPRRALLTRVFVAATVSGKKVVEGVDYEVLYSSDRLMARMTDWDAESAVVITYEHANIGNIADASPSASLGDVAIVVGGIDPSTAKAQYDRTAVDLFDNLIVPDPAPVPFPDHRDISLVEGAVTIRVI